MTNVPETATFGHGIGKDVFHAIPDGSQPSLVKSEVSDDSIQTLVPPVIALCGTWLVPEAVEVDVDRRATVVAGKKVCGTCARSIAAGVVEFPEHARGEKVPGKKGSIRRGAAATGSGADARDPRKTAEPKKKKSTNGSKPRTTAKKAVRSTLSDADEKKLQRVAKKLEAEQKIPAAGVVTVGRKLVKFHRGLRSSRPVLSNGIKREHVETIEIALGLAKKGSKTAA